MDTEEIRESKKTMEKKTKIEKKLTEDKENKN
jgi:hypothetical protein